jgi:hypothetical protein
MKINAKTIFAISVIALTIYCVISVVPLLINQWQFIIKSREELNNLANHLGVTADWDTVAEKINCDILIEGETLAALETNLQAITPIKVVSDDDQSPLYTIYFTKPYVVLDAVGLDFDATGHLVGKFQRVGFGDIAPIHCP